jgi:hypothetical protein
MSGVLKLFHSKVVGTLRGWKKWDWLQADTAKALENQQSRRCLSQFFHSLSVCRNVRTAHGVCLLRYADGTRSVPATICSSYFCAVALLAPPMTLHAANQDGLASDEVTLAEILKETDCFVNEGGMPVLRGDAVEGRHLHQR